MAHSFLKQLDDSTSGGYNLLITLCFCGSFFLINSFISELLFPDKELSILTAMLSSFFFGLPIIYNAIKDVVTGRLEMNELAALSFSASFFTSQYRTASGIALFMIVSHLIEYRSQLKASKNIEELLRLSPETASVLTDGVYVSRSTTSLKKNDTVQVLPGYKIPGDGIVLNGFSTVDESAITGESNPVEKRSNCSVYGGTINISGRLVIRITKESSESFISKIKDLIDQAEKSRTPMMRLITKYAVWYTPVVLMLTFILLFLTKDINRAISVLIVACPCTVLLSAPSAMMAALSVATRLGILFRNVSSLEIIKKVDTVIFDKTGTLTHGCFNVVSVKPINDMNADQILFYVGSVEVIKIPTSIQHISINDAFITEANQRADNNSTYQTTISSNIPGLLITGDKNLVQGTWEINYHIEYSPEKHKSLVRLESFIKNTGTMDNAKRIIQKISEQAIITVVAGTTVSDFVTGRINLNLIGELIQKMADSLHSGITVMNVSASHYGPHSVLANDFQAANQAESEKALQIENAIRYRMTTLSEAAGENWEELLKTIDNYQSSKSSVSENKTDSSLLNKVNEILFSGRIGGNVALQLDNARIDKTRTIEKSRSFESQFNKLLPAYRIDPRVVKNQLFQDVILEVLNGPLIKVRWLPSGARLYMSDLNNEDYFFCIIGPCQ